MPFIGAAIGAIFASKAAGAQAAGANKAANLQFQLGEESLDFQKQQAAQTRQDLAPWLQAGTKSINSLVDLLLNPQTGQLTGAGQSFLGGIIGKGPWGAQQFDPNSPFSPWTGQFQAPTAAQAAATPGYQFALQQGQNAIQNSAAAQGGLLSTGAMKTLAGYTTGLANQTYSDTYNRALAEYQQSYNIFQGNQTNTFNRLAALSGIGQTTATNLGQFGQQAAGNVANINATTGGQVGGSYMAAGNANASGYAGIANALMGGVNSLSQYGMLAALLNQGGAGAAAPGGL